VTSTDGVGTKVALAQALDRHDTIGRDLVAMVIDDIVVVGATPLFLTDYIACGKVDPERIATIVSGIAEACAESNVALIGGETAEHPGILGVDEYDLAAASTGVVEKDQLLGPERVRPGDEVVAIGSSGLHSNGYSLVRHIIDDANMDLASSVGDSGELLGDLLLEPTLIYTPAMLAALDAIPGAIHSASHITGGGIVQNLQRVLPPGSSLTLSRGSWRVPAVFSLLAEAGGISLTEVEDTWNLGVGFALVVQPGRAKDVASVFGHHGHDAWIAGHITDAGDQQGEAAKGVAGGVVRLEGSWS